MLFGSKRRRDKLKACFQIDNLGSPLCQAELFKNVGVWLYSDFSLSKHVQSVCKSCFVQIHDMSDGLLLMMHLYLCPIILSVVSWIIIIHFLEFSPSSICINYSASKRVQLELYQTPIDASV